MADANITSEHLRSILSYNSITGEFFRRKTGRKITCKDARGYIVCGLSGKQFRCHRLAWLYVYGYMPPSGIDHFDGDKSNNAIGNLRLASQKENSQNLRGEKPKSESGLLGVSADSFKRRWVARIRVDGVNVYLGRFDNQEEAHLAYLSYKRVHHSFSTI